MKLTAPENFDGDAATDRLNSTWKAQVDLSRLNRPDSQVYARQHVFLRARAISYHKTNFVGLSVRLP